MFFDGYDNKISRLAILQRIELTPSLFANTRKLFGRNLFTNFLTKVLLSKRIINHNYYNRILEEYNSLKKYIDSTNRNIQSIGSEMSGLELIINNFNDGN